MCGNITFLITRRLSGRGETRQWSVIIRRRLHWQLFHSIEQRRGIYRADVLPLSASIFPASHRGKIEQSPCFLRRCGIIARVFFHSLALSRDNRPLVQSIPSSSVVVILTTTKEALWRGSFETIFTKLDSEEQLPSSRFLLRLLEKYTVTKF